MEEQNVSQTELAAAAPEELTEADKQLLDRYSRTFIGSYSHSLDSKGRLVIPQAFRESLGKTFCIAPSYDFESIAIYPNLMWARMRHHYEELSRRSSALNGYLEQLDALSYRDQECDIQGRVLLPGKIRSCILGDSKELDITGANDHVRVVVHTAAEEQFKQFKANLSNILETISAVEMNMAGSFSCKE